MSSEYLQQRAKVQKEHPTILNPEKLKKATNKQHIPGQLYLDKGLPCEFFSIPAEDQKPKTQPTPKGKKKQKSFIMKKFLDQLHEDDFSETEI